MKKEKNLLSQLIEQKNIAPIPQAAQKNLKGGGGGFVIIDIIDDL